MTGVETSEGIRVADAYVVAMGSHGATALRKIGISVPVYPVKGYSLTVPVKAAEMAPFSTIMDETYKTAITRLGDRIRIGGTAELDGFNMALRSGRKAALAHSFCDLFPKAGDMSKASFWCGLRPMTPDGPPIVGASPVRGLYLNMGHGTLGWTMACGSGRVLADIVGGREPEIDIEGLSLSRYER